MELTWEKHLDLLDKVLTTLRKRGVKIKLSKCQFSKLQILFLGHLVSRDGISKPPEYIKAIVKYKLPTTTSQMRKFLGLVGFQRKFMPR